MGVDIDGLDPLARDDHLTPPRMAVAMAMLGGRGRHGAMGEGDA